MVRDSWSSSWQFIFSALAYCVGLGNIWRFPYLCADSGAGAFLIPYFLITIVMGTTLLYTEIALGQMTQKGPIQAFGWLKKYISGIGLANIMIIFLLSSYYVAVVAWGLRYLITSLVYLGRELPWAGDITSNKTRQYWDDTVLKRSEGLEYFGGMVWENFGCLMFTWVAIFLTIFKGRELMAYIARFCVSAPYIILLILLVVTAITDGAVDGILYFVTPRWEQLLEIDVWKNAAVQVFNSIGIACGSMIVYGSYIPQNDKNLLKNTVIIVFLNCIQG